MEEGKKQQPGSQSSSTSYSLTSELFGSKESSLSPSAGIFGSMFSPSSTVVGKESLLPERKGDSSAIEAWSAKHGAPDYSASSDEGDNDTTSNGYTSPFFEDHNVHPCPLSSSIYYGGQDDYRHPQSKQSTKFDSTIMKDGTEDDSGAASRGNWWQGSLYY